MDKNFDDAKLLSSSIVGALDLLYVFRVMWSRDTYEDSERTIGAIFTIRAAAEQLYNIMEKLEEENDHEQNRRNNT